MICPCLHVYNQIPLIIYRCISHITQTLIWLLILLNAVSPLSCMLHTYYNKHVLEIKTVAIVIYGMMLPWKHAHTHTHTLFFFFFFALFTLGCNVDYVNGGGGYWERMESMYEKCITNSSKMLEIYGKAPRYSCWVWVDLVLYVQSCLLFV